MSQKWCQNFSTLLYITTKVIWKKNFKPILHLFYIALAKKIFFWFFAKNADFKFFTFSAARKNVFRVNFELKVRIMVIFKNFQFHIQILKYSCCNFQKFLEISWNFTSWNINLTNSFLTQHEITWDRSGLGRIELGLGLGELGSGWVWLSLGCVDLCWLEFGLGWVGFSLSWIWLTFAWV